MHRNPLRIALFTALVAMLVLIPSALAKGRPGGGTDGSSSLSVRPLNGATQAHFGAEVTFDVKTTAERPQVEARCYRNGVQVYSEFHGFFEGAWFGQIFTLGPTPSWSGGDADCTARLFVYTKRGTQSTLATTSFHVYA